VVRIFHFKTGEPVDMPLLDTDGSDLWPDLTTRLDAGPRTGTLMVTRDSPDRFKGICLPWQAQHFLRTVAKIRKAAGIDSAIKFMGLRHGGNTEGSDANLTDAQLRALSGQKSDTRPSSTRRRQLISGDAARLRRDSTTKAGKISE
jgi:hypothetical protein